MYKKSFQVFCHFNLQAVDPYGDIKRHGCFGKLRWPRYFYLCANIVLGAASSSMGQLRRWRCYLQDLFAPSRPPTRAQDCSCHFFIRDSLGLLWGWRLPLRDRKDAQKIRLVGAFGLILICMDGQFAN